PTQDMFDLKPHAPAEVRGEFKPVTTSAPGVQICELLPQAARWMHRAALVRSVNHKGGCHNPLPSYTGYEAPVTDLVTTRETYPPSMGSVCEYLRGGRGDLPDYVYMPCYLGWGQAIRRPGPYAGFLGQRYDALFTECSPSIDKEDPRSLDRYGRTLFGNSTLIARRLVEVGVRFINVTWDVYWERLQLQYDGWDTHTRNFAILRDYNLPYFDRTFAALMHDLSDRG